MKLPGTSNTCPEILVPSLNNSEETISGSNKIKDQHETMKLQNKFHLKPSLLMNWNRPAISTCITEISLKSDFLRKKLYILS